MRAIKARSKASILLSRSGISVLPFTGVRRRDDQRSSELSAIISLTNGELKSFSNCCRHFCSVRLRTANSGIKYHRGMRQVVDVFDHFIRRHRSGPVSAVQQIVVQLFAAGDAILHRQREQQFFPVQDFGPVNCADGPDIKIIAGPVRPQPPAAIP